MKKLFLLLFFIMMLCNVISEQKIMLSGINKYGGKTIKYILSPEDNYGDQIKSTYYFYNIEDTLMEILHEFTDSKANETNFGFKNQSEKFRDGSIYEYKLEVADKFKKIKGISWQIDRVDSKGNIYEFEYSDGVSIAKSNPQSFVVDYPFYALPYLEEILFEDYEENEHGDVYSISAVYRKARTFIDFISDPIIVNANDKEKISFYLSHLNQQQHTDIYTHKANIRYLDKQYVCYLQSNFVSYIKKNTKCLLTYQFMGINKELLILATEFNEIE